MNAAEYLKTLDSISERIQRAAIDTLEAHRPLAPDHLSRDCVDEFLRRLGSDTLAIGQFVHEAEGEQLDDNDRALIANHTARGDAAEAGRIFTKAVRDYAHAVLAANYGQMYR